MAETEREIPLDDVEITDLDQPGGPVLPRWPRLTPRQREMSLLITSALFLLVLALLLNSTGAVRGLLERTFLKPAPPGVSNTLPVYLRGNPSWGQFTLDGRPLVHLPVIGKDKPLMLTSGAHTIIWHAAPFRARSCAFTATGTATVHSSCFLDGGVVADYVPNGSYTATIISFFASSNDLPADQHAALLQQIQQAMAGYGGSEMVQPGEPYAVSEQTIEADPSLCTVVRLALCFTRANQPLRATLRLQMDTSTSPDDPCVISEACRINDQDCRAICDGPPMVYMDQVKEGWTVAVVIRLSWTYTTLAGQVVARDQPDSAIRGDQGYQVVSVNITRDSQGWHVFPFPRYTNSGYDDPLCSQSAQDFLQLSGTPENQNMYIQQLYDAPDHLASGCLAVLKSQPQVITDPRTPVSAVDGQPVASFLVRFGVVLAVNDNAHKLWPYLPVADAYEKSVARQLLAAAPLSA
jgi:hypothetical protein